MSNLSPGKILENIIFYDGECGLCHRFVLFVLRRDHKGVFRFAPLQGTTFSDLKSKIQSATPLPDSIVVLDDSQKFLTLSAAVIYVLETIGGCWRFVSKLLKIFPQVLRDFGYRFIAAIRKKIFAVPDNVCPVVAESINNRFLP